MPSGNSRSRRVQATDSPAATLFEYPQEPQERRHGPAGYTGYKAYKPWLRDDFTFRCVYCLTRERWSRRGQTSFSVEHVVPQSEDKAQITEYTNLLYACTDCNSARQNRVVLNPCQVTLGEHLRVHADGVVEGLTPQGKAHVKVLGLADPVLTEFRGRLLALVRHYEGSDPLAANPDTLRLLHRWLGFPDDLPDLASLRPPGGNSKPAAVQEAYYERRERGELPERY